MTNNGEDRRKQSPDALRSGSSAVREAARRWGSQIVPVRGLGVLEDLALKVAGLQNMERPEIVSKQLLVFAGDHGVASEHVSVFEQSATRSLCVAIGRGGGVINKFCDQFGARLVLVDVGIVGELPEAVNTRVRKIREGTHNISCRAAMSETECRRAIEVGRDVASKALEQGQSLIGVGEIGIANTTVGSALAGKLLEMSARLVVGRGTGVSDEVLEHKRRVVEKAWARCRASSTDTVGCLASLGGFEIAAMVGAYLEASDRRAIAAVDGFTSSVAALAACRLNSRVREVLVFSHRSGERGHGPVLEAIEGLPLVNLEMRLGEGTGAVIGMALVELSCRILREVDCF